MSSSRYPDNPRYGRDRSPYRDRRPSTYGGGYPPRSSDSSSRPNTDSTGFPPRDTPRGPKSLVDAPRGPISGPPSGAPSAPRDGRGRGFAGRGEAPSLRDAPPLSTAAHHHNSWRADRDRDRDRDRDFDRDRRDRRPSPRRSPIRDSRDSRDQRDFPPRDLDINRARRNSRDGPPSAGSTYSDPPLGTGSSYRGSGIGRGRGGRDFSSDMRGRGRNFHDDRDRHHDPRDRMPDRSYRPRSRSRDPIRRDRDIRDDRDFDRRDRDDRRFVQREYDSYIGPAGASKSITRPLDAHRGSGPSDSRHIPGTPTGPSPHSAHHASTADRLGPSVDSYSRRSSVATEPSSAKDSRRDPGRDDALLASRAEASRERYAPRASSPPAAVPAFGFSSNVWRNPALDAKPSAAAPPPKPAQSMPSAPVTSSSTALAPSAPAAPKPSIPSGLSTLPPTGPKADRVPDHPHGDAPSQDSRAMSLEQPRVEAPSRPPPTPSAPAIAPQGLQNAEPRSSVTSSHPAPVPASAQANSLPQGPAARIRAPPIGPQGALRPNVSPSYSRPQHLPYAPRDSSPGAIPPTMGSRSGSGGASALPSTSPKSLPANIPTGPKADRGNPMAARPPPMYPPPDRSGFGAPRMPMGGPPKSMQWIRPGLNLSNRTTIPSKREFPSEDRDRSFGTPPKNPKFENNTTITDPQRQEKAKSESPVVSRPSAETERRIERATSAERTKAPSPKPIPIETRRLSDVSMIDVSHPEKPPKSATSSAPEVMEDSDEDLDLDEDDFAESEAKYNRERALLESKRVDLSASHLRATTPLQEIMLLSCLTIDHLPRQETKSVEEEREELVSLPSVQPPPESITTELPTPKAEESEDVVMDDKEEKPLAPATRALRLRREPTPDQEPTPDLSSLPYLGSGPPTPLSDLDQDRPSLPDSVMLAIRNKLRDTIEPELDTEDALQQYAAAYRQWRLSIRELDDMRDHDDPERQQSVEPGLKVTTPDVQSSAMAAMLEVPPPTTGRRSHSSRWATELDLETVIKESLKTAEEERMGKKEKEPRKIMPDPEKEATLPLQLTESEAQRRRFIDTNFQREPGQGIFVFHYEPPEDDFTETEHKIMVQHYRDQYAKKWGKLAEMLYKEAGTSRTYKDCINHYYATKWGKEYKGKLKGRRGIRRPRGGRGRGAIANMERPEMPGDDALPVNLTDSGRPRRLAAPTFGAETDDAASTPTPRIRRGTDADGTQEKVGRGRGKGGKERGRGRAKNAPLAVAPAGSPLKIDRKEKALGVKTEDEFGKGSLEMTLIQSGITEDQVMLPSDAQVHQILGTGIADRPKTQASTRPGPSSYWSVNELQDFPKNVAHFGTDWVAIANHMGTKTHTMVKNQYLRLVEGGTMPDLERQASEADKKRERGEDLGPPPTPTPAAPKRRYDPSQTNLPRPLAPTPEVADLVKSPAVRPTNTLPKGSPPASTPAARFSTIAQAPPQVKPVVAATTGFPSAPDPTLASVPSMQQSPPAQPPRTQSQHHHQHSLSQHKPPHQGPRAGYFSDEFATRPESRSLAQSSAMNQPPRHLQQVQPPIRTQEQSQPSLFRPPMHQEREGPPRSEAQQDHDAQHKFHPQHSRRISQEMPLHRSFASSGGAPTIPQMRSTSGAGSPDNRPLPLQHSRHVSQTQQSGQDYTQPSSTMAPAQQPPTRPVIGTPPIKEELRHYPMPPATQSQAPPTLQSQSSIYSQPTQAPAQATPPSAPKPAEPRKSNLLSLLNDTEPEEPRRKKPSEQSVPSHTPTPQQQAPIAPPPPVTQALPPRREPYGESNTAQPSYGRSSFAQQSSLPQAPSSRQIVDLTSEQASGARSHPRDSWQQRPQFHPSQSQAQQPPSLNPHTGLSRPHFSDSRLYGDHRSVFAQHNAARHNPSPPPHAAYNNSPHLHSRTPSLSGPPGQQPRHGLNSTTPVQHVQGGPGAPTQVLQPNPYAQVDPSGSNPQASGPAGMRPSPHLHTSHLAQQRDVPGRNEQSQANNSNLPYSNPQTPIEHPAHSHLRGASIAEQYRSRDPRDIHHDFDARNSERDTSRELQHRADVLLREQRDALLSNPQLRSTVPPPAHQDVRYQPPPQDRGYVSQRSHTPLSRSEHAQHAPPLQHPPHSALGDNSHPIYSQRQQQEDPSHRLRDPFPRDSRIAERIREEQAQQQAAMRQEDYFGREREMREREAREREAQYRENMLRRDRDLGLRGPPPPGQHAQDQRPPPGSSIDWTSAVRQQQQLPQDRWQR